MGRLVTADCSKGRHQRRGGISLLKTLGWQNGALWIPDWYLKCLQLCSFPLVSRPCLPSAAQESIYLGIDFYLKCNYFAEVKYSTFHRPVAVTFCQRKGGELLPTVKQVWSSSWSVKMVELVNFRGQSASTVVSIWISIWISVEDLVLGMVGKIVSRLGCLYLFLCVQ